MDSKQTRPRLLAVPKQSFFLLGPRGTGKSTWLDEQLLTPKSIKIDLLLPTEYLKYKRDPEVLKRELEGRAFPDWVIVDEVQRLPEILDVVHHLLYVSKGKLRFALTGSSARKLKREGANLLAGRALSRRLFPFTSVEMGSDFDLTTALRYGLLPIAVNPSTDASREAALDGYVETYLREEIQQEALVRNLDGFFRFLQVCGVVSGQILNIAGVARDVGLARATVQGYFEILADTLVGWTLPSFRLRAKIKEVEHPKFYLFDGGVQRVLSGEIRNAPGRDQLGHLFEAFVLNEIRALDSYLSIGGQMAYWRTEAGTEVDLVWSRGARRTGVEIKHVDRWKPEYQKGLVTLLETGKIQTAYGVYAGNRRLKVGSVEVFPFREFFARILAGQILPGE